MAEHFRGHYDEWNNKRVKVIRDHFGDEWFKGKRILDLGAGYGIMSNEFYKLGAEITCIDGRADHKKDAYIKFPRSFKDYLVVDLNEQEWGVEGQHFDLVLCLGILYHLEEPEQCLRKCQELGDHLVLETETLDTSEKKRIVIEEPDSYDQSVTGKGTRASASYIEEQIEKAGMYFIRSFDERLNHECHNYTWDVQETENHGAEYRRMWFCAKQSKLRVAVCISGALRDFKKCWESINDHVIKPFNTDIFLKCWRPDENVVQWHGNSGTISDDCTPEEAIAMMKPKRHLVELFDSNQEEFFAKKLYNPYSDFKHGDNLRARVINCLAMYYNIWKCNELKKDEEREGGFTYDYVIRIRPDHIFKKALTEQMLLDIGGQTIAIPADNNYGGINDQIAWGISKTMDVYSDCYNNLESLYKRGTIFHPETFLRDHFGDKGLTAKYIRLPYYIKRPY